MQALLLAATSHAAEVSGLKQSLERTEEELGRVKKELEDHQGMESTLDSEATRIPQLKNKTKDWLAE